MQMGDVVSCLYESAAFLLCLYLSGGTEVKVIPPATDNVIPRRWRLVGCCPEITFR